MSPGDLESMRTEGEQHGLSRRETLTLLEHLDAVADQRNVAMSRLFDSEKARNEITADRDEARQEVAALRAQRDEIREAHRGEVAALTARLEAAERERGELRAEVVTLRADLEEWRRSHREAESLADQAKRRRERTLETVEARADAAEAKLAAIDAPFLGGALHHIEMLHADQRESRDREEALVLKLDAAEAKLAALVEAHDAWKRYGNPTSPFDLDEAIRAARGPA